MARAGGDAWVGVLLTAWMFAGPATSAGGAAWERGQAPMGEGIVARGQASTEWHGVRVVAPAAATAIRRALDEAARRLLHPGCLQLLKEFGDDTGRPLSERLAALSVDVRGYLGWIQFHDGSSAMCGNGWTLMYTVPGSRVVHVCKVAVESAGPGSTDYLAASVIHEMLHTLGLRENPPSSPEITGRVKRLCWARPR